MATWEANGRLYVLHPARWEKAVDSDPDNVARLETITNQLGMSRIRMELKFPVHSHTQWRQEEVNALRLDADSSKSEQIMALVVQLRSLRPEVVFGVAATSPHPLDQITHRVINEAVRLAAEPSYPIYSPESQIPNTSWKVQKQYCSADTGKSGLHLLPQQLLAKPSLTIHEITRATALLQEPDTAPTPRGKLYALVKSPSFSDLAVREIFGGISTDPQTQLRSAPSSMGNFQSLQRKQGLQLAMDQLIESQGVRFQRDARWEQELDRVLASNPDLDPSEWLWESSQKALAMGYWNRWRAIHEKILRVYPRSQSAVAAYEQLMLLPSSVEVQHWWKEEERRELEALKDQPNLAVALASATPASPFGKDNKGQPSSNDVKLVGFADRGSESSAVSAAHAIRKEPIESNRYFPSFFPPKMIGWAQQQINNYHPMAAMDPRTRLSAFCANVTNKEGNSLSQDGRQAAFHELSENRAIAGWCQVGLQEKSLLNLPKKRDVVRIMRSSDVPRLDGLLQDATWERASIVSLQDPWGNRMFPMGRCFSRTMTRFYMLGQDASKSSGCFCPRSSQRTQTRCIARATGSYSVAIRLGSRLRHVVFVRMR